MKFMGTSFLVALLGFLSVGTSAPGGELSLNLLILSQDPMGPYDALWAEITLKNSHAKDLQLSSHFPEGVNLEIRRIEDSNWAPVQSPAIRFLGRHCSVGESQAPIISGGKGISHRIALLGEYGTPTTDGKYPYRRYFPKTGQYALRALFEHSPGISISSNELVFEVKDYVGEDLKAAEWLAAREKPPLFLYCFPPAACETDVSAQEVIEKFPNTRFATWAKIYLASRVVGEQAFPGLVDPSRKTVVTEYVRDISRGDGHSLEKLLAREILEKIAKPASER